MGIRTAEHLPRPRPGAFTPGNPGYQGTGSNGATLLTPGVDRGPSYAVQPVLSNDHRALLASVDRFVVSNYLLDGDMYWVYPYA